MIANSIDQIKELYEKIAQVPELRQLPYKMFQFTGGPVGHAEKILARLDLPPCANVLDAGCGHGAFTVAAAVLRPDIEIMGVTLAAGGAEQGRDLAYKVNAWNAKFQVADYMDLPYGDEVFDAIIYCETLGYADLDRAMAEAARVLKPGGRVYINDIAPVERDLSAFEVWSNWAVTQAYLYEFRPIDVVTDEAARHGFTLDWEDRNIMRLIDMERYAIDRACAFHAVTPLPQNKSTQFKPWDCVLTLGGNDE